MKSQHLGVEEGESGVQSDPQQLEDNLGYMKL